jgi:hypothetical protein
MSDTVLLRVLEKISFFSVIFLRYSVLLGDTVGVQQKNPNQPDKFSDSDEINEQ